MQSHTELRFRLDAPSRAAVERGAFTLAIEGASRAAGTTVGRFLDLFDASDQARMIGAYQRLPAAREGAAAVQVSGGALSAAAENVARVPRVLPRLVALGEHHPPGAGLIPLADLAVTGDADDLWLVSLSEGRPVEPVAFHAIELTASAHPLVRFLCEIGTARAAACVAFSWGAARRLPFLPRLRHGRTILAPARWSLTAADLANPSTPFPTWARDLADWRTGGRGTVSQTRWSSARATAVCAST